MIINLNKLGGGGGITPEEVETIVDEKIATKVDYSEYENKIQEIDVGLATRAAVDLSNIDDKGKEVINDAINLKTINGESIKGEGNIVIQGGDMSDYYTKGEVDEIASSKVDYSEYENKVQEIDEGLGGKADAYYVDEQLGYKQDFIDDLDQIRQDAQSAYEVSEAYKQGYLVNQWSLEQELSYKQDVINETVDMEITYDDGTTETITLYKAI